MAAPFVTLFGCDEISSFEAVMSVFMWWGHSFHATYPHPPVHIIGITHTPSLLPCYLPSPSCPYHRYNTHSLSLLPCYLSSPSCPYHRYNTHTLSLTHAHTPIFISIFTFLFSPPTSHRCLTFLFITFLSSLHSSPLLLLQTA